MSKNILGLSFASFLFLGLAQLASADCLTTSRGLYFAGPTPTDVMYGCHVDGRTDYYECDHNVTCNGYPVAGPNYPVYPTYPSYPSYPAYPTYPAYPSRPSYPSYPSYPGRDHDHRGYPGPGRDHGGDHRGPGGRCGHRGC